MDCVLYEHDDNGSSQEPHPQYSKAGGTDTRNSYEEDEDYRSLAVEPLESRQSSGNSSNGALRTGSSPNAQQQRGQSMYHRQQAENNYGDYANADTGAQKQPGKLFIGGVSWETTEETLRDHFGKYGPLTDAALMKDKFSGQPRGFGFVTFADVAVLDRVLEESHTIDGRTVEVKRAIPRDKTASGPSDVRSSGAHGRGNSGGVITESKKVFVGGLPPSVTEQDFRRYFEEFGRITDAVVMFDRETQRSRGFGFVTFEEEGAVAEVISKTHELHGKVVEIKRAEPKEARSGGGYSGGYGGRSGGGGYGGRGYGGGYGGWRGGYGGYGGYAPYAGRGGGGGGYSNYGGGYGGYSGYPPGYGGYPGYAGYGGGRGGYGGAYGNYMGAYGGGYGGAAQGEGQMTGNEGGDDGYNEENTGYVGGAGGVAGSGGYAGGGGGGAGSGGYGGGYRQGGAGQMPVSRSERYRPY
uniref:Uncharacterized protein AlNc14C88G5606 n=1 Tax=Albugo laibachii Nc14 TaxID=890382 RepID=F0WG76_9STRA|nr:conserved unknown protein putative [Albugo laibachii Nc14]|eukprot:CCA20211.1 conserved unknown protein putative [Albugo laibachii Nc14]